MASDKTKKRQIAASKKGKAVEKVKHETDLKKRKRKESAKQPEPDIKPAKVAKVSEKKSSSKKEKKPPMVVAPPTPSDSDSDDSSDDSSSEEEEPKQVPVAASDSDSSDASEDSDSESDESSNDVKPVTTKAEAEEDSSTSDDEDESSDEDSSENSDNESDSNAKTASKKDDSDESEDESEDDSDDDDDSDDSAAVKKSKKSNGSDSEDSDDDDDDSSEDDSDESDTPKGSKKSQTPADDSDEDSDSDDDEEDAKGKASASSDEDSEDSDSDDDADEKENGKEVAKTEKSQGDNFGNKKRKADFNDSTPSFKRSRDEEEGGKSIFIGKISYDTDTDSLTNFFTSNGLEPTSVRIITDRNTGDSKGFGYADFESVEDAQNAIKLDGSELDGRYLRINDANAKPTTPNQQRRSFSNPSSGGRGGGGGGGVGARSDPSTCLFVKNLSYNTTQETLQNLFKDCKGVRIATDRETGRPRGFAHIDFYDSETATKALNTLQNKSVDGRNIFLDHAGQRSTFSPGGGGGGGRPRRGFNRFSGQQRGGGGSRGFSRPRSGAPPSKKGSIQEFKGSKISFD